MNSLQSQRIKDILLFSGNLLVRRVRIIDVAQDLERFFVSPFLVEISR